MRISISHKSIYCGNRLRCWLA